MTYSHIDNGVDFFDIDNLQDFDAVVSNPPFSIRDKIFHRLFESRIPFALIMNSNGLFDSKARWKLFKDNSFELLIPQGRMRFFNKDIEEDSKLNHPNFQSIYVCHGILEKQIEFVEGSN